MHPLSQHWRSRATLQPWTIIATECARLMLKLWLTHNLIMVVEPYLCCRSLLDKIKLADVLFLFTFVVEGFLGYLLTPLLAAFSYFSLLTVMAPRTIRSQS